jgi:DNA mismatch repair protein MSH5
MSDLQQISLCLKQVTGRSLVLIDEFGKGTNESGTSQSSCSPSARNSVLKKNELICIDGIGLACGILDHLLSLEDAPKVIAATHFHEIFENGLLEPRPRLQLGHMEVKVCEEFQAVEDQVTYLYKFVQPHFFRAERRWLTIE